MNTGELFFRLTLAVLAVWRVTHLLASEDGPADIIVRCRVWLGRSWVGKLMDCFNCLSLWIAAPVALFVSRDWPGWLMSWLAISGGACLLERVGRAPVVFEPLPESEGEEANHVLRSETDGFIEDVGAHSDPGRAKR